jgi:acyl-CoA reductase-like NAD-dependent aldehyde dehydrogenase
MAKWITEADRMLIGGELVESESRSWDESINPATEEVIGRAPAADRRDVDKAVVAAEKAWPEWAARAPRERADTLQAFGRKLLERADELLRIEVADTGNTINPMRMDVRVAVESLNYFGGLVYELKGDTLPGAAGTLHLTLREPYGIVGRIIPFNHPLMFAVSRTAAALAAGNAVIVKPPETSPLSSLVLAEIAKEVFPPGVFNIVTGNGTTAGDALVRHPGIKRIAFIGSVATGRAIQKAAAETSVKHVSLELGGKNPLIVFPDVDIETAARAAVGGMNFTWQGQSCGSTSRLLLHADIHDAVLKRVVELVSAFRIGDPMDPQNDVGPVNSSSQYQKVLYYLRAGQEDGAHLLVGGQRPQSERFKRGFWIEPAVFADVTSNMRLAREEVFGPILSIMRWTSEDEAVELANATEYGLTAAIWTNDIHQALRTARRVRSGFQWINGFSAHYTGIPFGGCKNSGVGREEGIEELLSYTESKTINIVVKNS